ncbi:MAG: GGDEF domain-containing protein, partial [Alphaproteobacteria bacterium]
DEGKGKGTTVPLGPGGDDLPLDAEAAIMRLLDEIETLRVELDANKRRIAYLENLADRDPLTPVVNRRAFIRELERAKSYAERYGGAASLIFFDLDGMKALNDAHGHACGDRALMVVAETLIANVRASDVVGRLGGDEFGVILAQADTAAAKEKAVDLAETIASAQIDTDDDQITLSASWGVVELGTTRDAAHAMECADQAMYAQKRANHDRPAAD